MNYDILFFEALGEEQQHLREELDKAKARGTIPAAFRDLIVPETLQDHLAAHPDTVLPDILSTKTHSVLPKEWMENGRKKSVITRSAGYDHFEEFSAIMNVTSLRRYCVNAVSETAVKMVLMAAGNYNEYHRNMRTFERNRCISFKEVSGLKATVFGVGCIGKRIYEQLSGLGLQVSAVDVRESELSREYGESVRFIPKEEALDSDVIVCGMNYTKNPASRFYNEGYFSREYLSRVKPGLVFVNVTRGEIADEKALYELYTEGRIFGIGLDTFAHERNLAEILSGRRAPENALEEAQVRLLDLSLSASGNVYAQPHQAFNSDAAARDKAKETVKHLEAYFKNGGKCFDSQLPYYT